MPEEIINRVASSNLMTIDLEDFYPQGERVVLDIKNWLYEGFVLREKEYRTYVEEHDWTLYKGKFVAVDCSIDAIIPGWAYMLITAKLQPYAKFTVQGNLEQLETSLYQTVINGLDVSIYKDKPVIIKGCSNKPVPSNAYLWITSKLIPIAKRVMYGEACSSVPLYKRR